MFILLIFQQLVIFEGFRKSWIYLILYEKYAIIQLSLKYIITFLIMFPEFLSLVTSEANEICSSSEQCPEAHSTVTLDHLKASLKVNF